MNKQNKAFSFYPFFLSLLIIFIACLNATQGLSQTIKGKVIDATSQEAIPYVHIGVLNKNRGVISHDKGQFQLDVTGLSKEEQVIFSILGYESQQIAIGALKEKQVISLKPKTYALQEVVVKPEEVVSTQKLGRHKTTKTTTGQSGIKDFGYGGEWGIKIEYPGQRYQLADVNFHTRFNSVDSVLYRIHVYELTDGMPGEKLLQKEVYTISYKKDKWITANLLPQQLTISSDIVVTFELIRIWFSPKGSNQLFFTHGKGYDQGTIYSRASSFDQWAVDARPPIALFVTARLLK